MAVGSGGSVGGFGITVCCVGVGGSVSVGGADVGVELGAWVAVKVGAVVGVALAVGVPVEVAVAVGASAGASIAFRRGWANRAVIPTQYNEALKRSATSKKMWSGRGL